MRWRGISLLAATLASFWALPSANAQDAAPSSHLYAGGSFGSVGSTLLSVDGARQPAEKYPFNFAVTAGYLQRLLPRFGVALQGSWGPTSSGWSEGRGEIRQRAGVTLAPTFALTLKPRHPTSQWRLGLPVGYSSLYIKPGPGRAVVERFTGGHGFSLGLVTGFDWFGTHHGGYFEAGYGMHVNWSTRHASSGSIKTSEEYRHLEYAALVGWGYAYRF